MGADEAIVYSITVAVALFGLGVLALAAIWLPHLARCLWRRYARPTKPLARTRHSA